VVILLDKQAKWNNRYKYYAMDKNGIDHMQQYLDRAEQIRKNIEAENTDITVCGIGRW